MWSPGSSIAFWAGARSPRHPSDQCRHRVAGLGRSRRHRGRPSDAGSALSRAGADHVARQPRVVSVPGAGRSNLLGFLAYNRNLRIKHLGAQQTKYHFVYLNFSEIKKKPLIEAVKFIFLGLVDSLRERQMTKDYETANKIFKDSLELKDELVLFQGLKKAVDYLALEKNLTIVFLFDRFEDYISVVDSEFFANLRVLRNRAKLFAGTNSGTFISTDNGNSWSPSFTGIKGLIVFSLTVKGTEIFAGTGNGLYHSIDNGASWSLIGLGQKSVNTILVNGTNYFAGTNNGIYLSTDNGKSWNSVSNGIPNLYIKSLTMIGKNIFGGSYGGAFLSSDNGNSWTSINNGISNVQIYSLMANNGNIFAGTSHNGVFLSTDSGTSWSMNSNGLSNNSWIEALAMKGETIFAGSNGIFLSKNNGLNWTASSKGMENVLVRSIVVSGENLWAGTTGGVFLSTNDGTNWKTFNTGLTNLFVYGLANNGTNLWAGTDGGGVFHSTENDSSWKQVNTGLGTNYIFNLAITDSSIIAGTDIGLYRMTNKDSVWTLVTSVPNYFISALFNIGSNIFAGVWEIGIYYSTDGGLSWTLMNTGLNNLFIDSFAADNTYLYVGTETGAGVQGKERQKNEYLSKSDLKSAPILWKRKLSELKLTGIKSEVSQIPSRFLLNQNYPNPFNPVTTINYSIPKSSFVKIKVYDALGREVLTLVNENKLVGDYSIQFNAAKHTSGVYFYRMQAGDFVQTKKLILLK